MASRINTEQEIYNCVDQNESFILDAGAGSGKTWTLIQTLKYLIENREKELKKANQKIVCITYTNAAKNEILERIERNSLVTVSTIHDFLWSCIAQYKKELKEKLIEYLNDKLRVVNTKISKLKRSGTKKEQELFKKREKYSSAIESLTQNNKPVVYKEYVMYNESIISHDDVIDIAYRMFSSYQVINRIIRDAYPVILVDEYQDTQEPVIKILCEHLHQQEDFLLGFFGDKMQKIYDSGIGEIPSGYNLKQLKKSENYRCSPVVIKLLNKIRTDIEQSPAGKNKNIHGDITFYSSSTISENELIDNYLKPKWKDDFSDFKILYLTHRLIARKNGYYDLFDLYDSKRRKDYLTDNKNNRGCPFANFLYSIAEVVELFETNRTQELLKNINLTINTFEDIKKIKDILKNLVEQTNSNTIEEVFDYVISNNLLSTTEKYQDFDLEDTDKKDFHEKLMKIEYKQFADLYQVQQNDTPFSTKHGTKGKEYENVLVIIDDTT